MFPLGPPRSLPHATCCPPATGLTFVRVLLFAGAGCGWEAFAQQRAAARFGGLPACADASRNLANPVHLDVGDGDRSFAVWMRGQPQLGEIVGHYLLFPHVGLAIELVDGVAVSWDGRVLAHCTSEPATAVRADDALFSLFFSLPIDCSGSTSAYGRDA